MTTRTKAWLDFCESANDLAAWDEGDVAQGLGFLLEDEWEMQAALGLVTSAVKAGFTVNEFMDWYGQVKAALERGETSGVVELEMSGSFAWGVEVS